MLRRIIFLLTLFLLTTSQGWCANRYAKIAGGNWSSANTWSATSSAGVDNAGEPTTSDAVILDAASATTGALVLDKNSNEIQSFTSSSNVAGTFTHGVFSLISAGNITFGSGMTYTPSAGAIILLTNTSSSTQTFATVGKTLPDVQFYGTGTGALIFSGAFTANSLKEEPSHLGTKKITFPSSTTTTIYYGSGFGNGTNLITCNVASLGRTATISKPRGAGLNWNYVALQGINFNEVATGHYGTSTQVGTGLNFIGQASAGDNVSVPNSASGNQLTGCTTYSIEAWVVARSGGASGGRIADGNVTFLLSTNNVQYSVTHTGGTATTALALTNTNALTFNVLHHVVGVYNANADKKCQVYIDGSVQALGTNTAGDLTPSGATTCYFGNRGTADRTFDGQIYAVRIYRNIALTSGNVTTLYNAGVKAVNPLGNATAEYLFNDATGATLTDRIAANNGTITGADWANTNWVSGNSTGAFNNG